MNTLRRFLLVESLTLLMTVAGCQSETRDPGTDSNTNWLKECETQAECGESYSCVCGVCTFRCSDDSSCEKTPQASLCRDSDEAALECGGKTTSLCLPECYPDCGADDGPSSNGVDAASTSQADATSGPARPGAPSGGSGQTDAGEPSSPSGSGAGGSTGGSDVDAGGAAAALPTLPTAQPAGPGPTNCPPCVPPPLGCVGTGICGCAPFVCGGGAAGSPGAGGSGGTSGAGGTTSASDESFIACSCIAVSDDAGCEPGELSWGCYDPDNAANDQFAQACRIVQTPQPTYCCSAEFRPQCPDTNLCEKVPPAACGCYDEADCGPGEQCYEADCAAGQLGGCQTLARPGDCYDDRDCSQDQICIGASFEACDATVPANAGICSAAECGDLGTSCAAGEVCVLFESGAVMIEERWECVANPCSGESLACECAESLCRDASGSCGGVGESVAANHAADVWCASDQRCASPDTKIATPDGERFIAELEAGDLVYSVDEGQIVPVPLLRTQSLPAPNHRVLHIEFDDGSRFEISAGHPMADGRPLSVLRPGDSIENAVVVSVVEIPYAHSRTYDILPASRTGTYFADGVLLGSTMTVGERDLF